MRGPRPRGPSAHHSACVTGPDHQSPVFIAARNGRDNVIVTLARARASLNDAPGMGLTPIMSAAIGSHDVVVRLLAHLGARLLMPTGSGFWCNYQDNDTRQRMHDFWQRVIAAGGDEPTEESRRIRRRMMIKAKMHDPRDGGPHFERI